MRHSPGCTCCTAPKPCGCRLRCWPWCADDRPMSNTFAGTWICYRPLPEQIRYKCHDLLLSAVSVTLAGVANDSCTSCTDFNGTHCLRYDSSASVESYTGPPSAPVNCEFYVSRVTWKSDADATCGPASSTPLPLIELEFTDDGTGQTWTLYLNTTDTRGGVATYTLSAASWQCGRQNTLTRATTGTHCTTPTTATIDPCQSCLRCELSGSSRLVYQWQIDLAGASGSACSPYSCSDLDGTYILDVGAVIGYLSYPDSIAVDQCTYSIDAGFTCRPDWLTVIPGVDQYEAVWWLWVAQDTTPPTIHVELVARYTTTFADGSTQDWLTSVAHWSGPLTTCSGPNTLTLDWSTDCDFSAATLTAKPL